MRRRCATCWYDERISHWIDPEGIKPRGTSESNWSCSQCRRRPHNRHWRNTPSQEVYGLERDADDELPVPDETKARYETPLCLEIMRLYCWGESQRVIAKKSGCTLSFVIKTVRHWKQNHGFFVSEVKRVLEKAV